MKRETCGACGHGDSLFPILDLGHTPLSNIFPISADETVHRYPLNMLQCARCGLAQIGEIVPDTMLWRGEYGYYSSTSPALRAHFSEYADDLVAREGSDDLRDALIVEVGCNDGLLMKELALRGCERVIGVDPAKGPVAIAQSLGLDARCDAFGYDWADGFRTQEGPADVVIANNVAAHVADLSDFLRGIRRLLSPAGVAIIEVQYLPDLLVGNGFDMLYHEHRFFWSLASLRRALALHGLEIFDVTFIDTQGGSIRVFVEHRDAGHADGHSAKRVRDALFNENPTRDTVTPYPSGGAVLEAETGLISGLQARANRIGERLRQELHKLRAAGLTVAGYGAPAKATTMLHWTRTADYLSWVEDTTPAKHGRYMPGTRLQIVPPTEGSARPDAYLLLSWNYAPYILHREREYLDQGGRFVVPLPAPITLGGYKA